MYVTWYSYNTKNDISHIKIRYKREYFSRNVLRTYSYYFSFRVNFFLEMTKEYTFSEIL